MSMRLSRHRLRSRLLLFLIVSAFLWMFLPYDNGLVLLIRWHFNSISRTKVPDGIWTLKPPAFPVDKRDVGLIIKTGFSTQERLVARLNTFAAGWDQGNLVLVGDYSTAAGSHFEHQGVKMPVYNALAYMIDGGSVATRPDALRLQYYRNLTHAISSGQTDRARVIGETYGWELDIMKHISALEIGYKVMPDRKWYILLDDDSYLLDASLEVILGSLDPLRPHYIGNAIGDYKARFAHGGSAVVFSQAAMHKIFVQNTDIVSRAHLESLDSKWGDKLIATTAMKTGIYLDEAYGRNFNGEPPLLTRIRPDRFCVPIAAFHKLSPSQMQDVGKTFKDTARAISWIDIWAIYKAPKFESFLDNPIRSDWDHVGGLDEATTTTKSVATKEACLKLCLRHGSSCLAWTWEVASKACHISPWIIVGSSSKGKYSGINAKRITNISRKCR